MLWKAKLKELRQMVEECPAQNAHLEELLLRLPFGNIPQSHPSQRDTVRFRKHPCCVGSVVACSPLNGRIERLFSPNDMIVRGFSNEMDVLQ
eukprot:1049251-Amphidinium_carterae.1